MMSIKSLLKTFHRRGVEAQIASFAPSIVGKVLSLGCGPVDYRSTFVHASKVVNLDLHSSAPHIDVRADVQELPFDDCCFDVVCAFEVLEHIEKPSLAVSEAFRVLKPGGQFIVSVPFLFRVHGDPADFQRFTDNGIRVLLADFDMVVIHPHGNRLTVILDLISTGCYFCRVLRLVSIFSILRWRSADAPSGYIVFAKKGFDVE